MFKDILKSLRLEHHLTQTKIAKDLDITQQQYAKWESGERKPNSDTLEKLADYFVVSTDYLLGRKNKAFEESIEDDQRLIKELKNGGKIYLLDEAIADWIIYLSYEDKGKVLELISELVLKDRERIEKIYSRSNHDKLRSMEFSEMLENAKKKIEEEKN